MSPPNYNPKVSVCCANPDPSIDNPMVNSILKWSSPYEIVQVGGDKSFKETVRGINIIGIKPEGEFYYYSPHAGGLHIALDNARGDYILFCDYDVIFLSDVIGYYLSLISNYNASIVGCSHCSDSQCYAEFPSVTNCMVKHDDLPSADFLKGHLRTRSFLRYGFGPTDDNEGKPCDGMWLCQTPILKYYNNYPRPSGFFDVGHSLWLWNHERSGKWISFTSQDGHFYDTSRFYTNLDSAPESLFEATRSLVWHKTGLSDWSGQPIV